MGYELVRLMNQRQLPPNEKAVWKALGDHASDVDGRGAWPSQKTLAQETGYSERQVQRILRKLEARGAIVETRPPGRRTSREYRIVTDPPCVVESRPVKVAAPDLRPDILSALDGTPAEVKTGHFDHQDRTSCHSRPDILTVKTGHPDYQTLIEPSVNPKKNPPDARARESRDIVVGSEPARESMPEISEASLKKDEQIFRRGCADVSPHLSVISNDEVIRKREARKRELEEQKTALKINRAEGISRVTSPAGKYS